MPFIVRISTAAVSACLIALALGWNDPYYVAVGRYAALFATAGVAALLWGTRPRKSKHPKAPTENHVRNLLAGLGAAGLWTGVLLLYFLVLAKTPALVAQILDRDRPENGRVIAQLIATESYREAASVTVRVLTQGVHSQEYTQQLAADSMLYLTRAAKRNPSEAPQLLKDALAIAHKYNLPPDLAQNELDEHSEREARSALQRQLEDAQAQSDALRQKLDENRHRFEVNLNGQLDALRREGNSRLAEALKTSAAFTLSQAIGFCGDVQSSNLEGARTRLAQLIAVATKHGVSTEAGTKSLHELDALIAVQTPSPLPAGTTARLIRVHAGVMPQLMVLDLAVNNQANAPLLGLTSRDFVATQGDGALRLLAAPESETRSLNALAIFDVSASTEGAPNAASRAAGPELIRRLPSATFLRVASFSDTVKPLSAWTSDRSMAIAACTNLKAAGGTALADAMWWGVQDLRRRPGERVLILFSDGAGSIPGPPVQEIVRAAREAQVAVYFVALTSAGYNDTAMIEQIARETGGESFLVSRADQLVATFGKLAEKLSETGYRLAILNCDPARALDMQIGGANAVRFSIPGSAETETALSANKR